MGACVGIVVVTPHRGQTVGTPVCSSACRIGAMSRMSWAPAPESKNHARAEQQPIAKISRKTVSARCAVLAVTVCGVCVIAHQIQAARRPYMDLSDVCLLAIILPLGGAAP